MFASLKETPQETQSATQCQLTSENVLDMMFTLTGDVLLVVKFNALLDKSTRHVDHPAHKPVGIKHTIVTMTTVSTVVIAQPALTFTTESAFNGVSAHVSSAEMNTLHDLESDETVTNASVSMVDGSVLKTNVMESVPL